MELEGKTAVVTGGGTGIGRASAEKLAAGGAHVFVAGRRQAELDETVAAIGPESATAVVCDISDLGDLDRLYEVVRSRAGELDILFANAATAEVLPLGEVTEEHFDRTFGVNVRGTFFTVQKALPLLREGGSVILCASSAAELGEKGLGIYAATKAAVRNLGRTWCNELAGRRIRVNVVSPGPVETPGIATTFGEENLPAIKAQVAETLPIERMAQPEEIASVVAFLASQGSSYLFGANIVVDGGQTQI
jgi:NAD(P)-dependent dehydrogenase (short-subunit alcohol dehydrogenase family)